MKKFLLRILWGMLALSLAACSPRKPVRLPETTVPTLTLEPSMIKSLLINEVRLDKSFYKPGETVHLSIKLNAEVTGSAMVTLTANISHLAESIQVIEQSAKLRNGIQEIQLSWTPPPAAPRGYGVDLNFKSESREQLASTSTAFDVLQSWTQAPRYGFLSDFQPARTDITSTLASINQYHLNALQFYDWMYRHDQFLTDQDPYQDPLGRTLSRKTVDALIDNAHSYDISAMAYTAVYAASLEFFRMHPDWALLGPDGNPLMFGDNFLAYMDPRPGSPWTLHLLDQFDQILKNTAFDGIHLDQYGDPKVGYDKDGLPYRLDQPLAQLIDATHQHVKKLRPGGAVVFNAVTNWPIEAVAPSDEDIVYIEVWPPYNWFSELGQLVVQAQKLGYGKAVVIAAYISPSLEHNVRLADAVIFSNGGGHIELGERNAMLADAYFPKYEQMSPQLSQIMQRYYDFAIRYENVIGPSTQDATGDYRNRIEIGGTSLNPSLASNTILPAVRQSSSRTAISLVNLLGVQSPDWKNPIPEAPTPLGATQVRLTGIQDQARRVWMASPDGLDISLHPLAFNQSQGQIEFQLPGLSFWDMILIEWGE
jgi:dextranase